MTKRTIEPVGGPAELLLVEDNWGDVLLAQDAFRRAKIRNHLAVAVDGEEAVSMLRKEGRYRDQPRPDLVLLDLNLPRMDGREVLHQIRSDPALRAIPVIVLAGSSGEADLLTSSGIMADGFVVKPVTFDRLEEAVGSIDSFSFTTVMLPPAATREGADAG